ncbi:MAG: nitrile hydratase accessory protein [Deltaproteobacteria bacterium]|nr:nitrile hydratase accessory protein [Deltaproteobacteria bacterium]
MNTSEALTQLAVTAKLDPARLFSAPWEARAFAIAIKLEQAGAFKWSDFRERLIEEVRRGDASQSADSLHTANHYHEHFLRALERIIDEKGLLQNSDASARDNRGLQVMR